MATYRTVSMSFWTDSKVDDDFTPEDKYFYLYLLTNPHTNICGCYEISMRQMERETGYNADTIKRLLNRMEKVHNVIRFHEPTKEVLILNWSKYNWSASDKLRKAVAEVAEHIKFEEFKKIVLALVTNKLKVNEIYSIQYTVTDTVSDVSIGYEYPIDTVSDSEPQKRSARFVPPSVEEVAEYCKQRNNNVNPQRFVDFYESKGWLVGKTKMKDWRAAVRNWEARDNAQAPKKQGNSNSSIDLEEAQRLFNQF